MGGRKIRDREVVRRERSGSSEMGEKVERTVMTSGQEGGRLNGGGEKSERVSRNNGEREGVPRNERENREWR